MLNKHPLYLQRITELSTVIHTTTTSSSLNKDVLVARTVDVEKSGEARRARQNG